MKKRRLRLNILDIVIFAAVLCAVALVVFSNEIDELLGEPNIKPIELQLNASGISQEAAHSLKSGDNILLYFTDSEPNENTAYSSAVITEVRIYQTGGEEDAADVGMSVILQGYRRIGVFYSENAQKLTYGAPVTVVWDGGNGELSAQPFGVESAEYVPAIVLQ